MSDSFDGRICPARSTESHHQTQEEGSMPQPTQTALSGAAVPPEEAQTDQARDLNMREPLGIHQEAAKFLQRLAVMPQEKRAAYQHAFDQYQALMKQLDTETFDQAGAIFANGKQAGLEGADAEQNPYDASDPAAGFWERGRAVGIATPKPTPAERARVRDAASQALETVGAKYGLSVDDIAAIKGDLLPLLEESFSGASAA